MPPEAGTQPGRVLFCILDGLGGLARQETLRSELEQADVTNLDRLAVRSEVGLTVPLTAGRTPDGIEGYLALLGVDGPFEARWGVRAAAVAAPGSGLARAAEQQGIRVEPCAGPLPERIEAVRRLQDSLDIIFLGWERTGEAGLEGDFEGKARALHEFDSALPELLGLGADVFVVAGDRSVPALAGQATWHPVPFLVQSAMCREGNAQRFNEQENLKGSLGLLPARDVMPLVMAHALRPGPRSE